ncbi:ribonuclease P protein component 1 [Acidilobus sp.]|jgi:ribonuclease P protein subunit POP4|uniref:ribonuclease P protein component 1 n=1 Tax=Acidilobus sp. TaxID=1872109 RepID=UPI003D072DD2
MKFTSSNIKFRPLVGLKVKVISSTDPSLLGVSGTVVGDSKNALRLRVERGNRKKEITIIKLHSTFSIVTPDGNFIVRGLDIIGRPEERLKKAISG